MMEHPIHLHGMWMERSNGAGPFKPRKHTVSVKPAERLSVAISADARGCSALHCHLLLHMDMGMFRVVEVVDDLPGAVEARYEPDISNNMRVRYARLPDLCRNGFLCRRSGSRCCGTRCHGRSRRPTAFADDLFYSSLSPKDKWASPVADSETFNFFIAEILEYRLSEEGGEGRWDTYGWRGGDYNRVWIKSEGNASGGKGENDFQLLYGRLDQNSSIFRRASGTSSCGEMNRIHPESKHRSAFRGSHDIFSRPSPPCL